jgi:hypothetical protein
MALPVWRRSGLVEQLDERPDRAIGRAAMAPTSDSTSMAVANVIVAFAR